MSRADLVFERIVFSPTLQRTLRLLLHDARLYRRKRLAEREHISESTARDRLDTLRQLTGAQTIDELHDWIEERRDALSKALDGATQGSLPSYETKSDLTLREGTRWDWAQLVAVYGEARDKLGRFAIQLYWSVKRINSEADKNIGWRMVSHRAADELPREAVMSGYFGFTELAEQALFRFAAFEVHAYAVERWPSDADSKTLWELDLPILWEELMFAWLPLSALDRSLIRSAMLSSPNGEIAEFVRHLRSDEEGRSLLNRWSEWLESCPGDSCDGECDPHLQVAAAAEAHDRFRRAVQGLAARAGLLWRPQTVIEFDKQKLELSTVDEKAPQ